MKSLSAPLFVLRRRARELKQTTHLTMTEALDQIARQEGFSAWSLLMSKSDGWLPSDLKETASFLNPGDLVLVGARPRNGKTIFATNLINETVEHHPDISCFFFTLVEREADVRRRLSGASCRIDCSDEMSADHITKVTRGQLNEGSVIIVDYLQLLDEKRVNPPIETQITQLKDYARETGCIFVFLSQLDRKTDDRQPTQDDIRRPNPLDLGLFNKIFLLYQNAVNPARVNVELCAREKSSFTIGIDRSEPRLYDLV